MPRITILPTLLRETISQRTLPREPEPDLVMDDGEQVAAYAQAGRIDGVMSAAYLFQTARISQTVSGAKKVLDLGCGPATQLCQVAELNPEISFTGMDLSGEMLESGRRHIGEKNLTNVEFLQGDITRLDSIAESSFDGVISTMALHHLPTFDHLKDCFREIARVLRPDGALYLVDFGRLKSLKSVLYFAYMNRAHQPHLFSLDYERSLRAAFLPDEFRKLAAAVLPPETSAYTTAQIPILNIVKSPDRKLDPARQERLKIMRSALPRRYRRELDDMRLFFWLGGLRNDPFRGSPRHI
jgi:ubiquinone/menaquinone biosynthesis C-methylase UbiE